MLQLFLPYPPSVNNYWGFSQSRRYLTAKARAFKDEVHYKVIQSRYPSFGKSYIRVGVELYPPDRRKRDIDNPLKPLFDSLVASGLIEDDSQIQELIVVRKEVIKGGSCRISIEKI